MGMGWESWGAGTPMTTSYYMRMTACLSSLEPKLSLLPGKEPQEASRSQGQSPGERQHQTRTSHEEEMNSANNLRK